MDITFGYPVLMMGIDAAVLDLLILLFAARSEFFGGKYSIIGVVASNLTMMLRGKQFKKVFCLDGFFCSCREMWSKV